ncbi:helix-turn-helix domain-containing protein [Nonomuraea roseoviolacea]|uniref:DNA-binding transcriptional MerR regulator n=1 Tax=Nonomuraea roseoviolacea subsp. carminata TaxID=160689 RepID=A0ABT1JRP1_9ACTN|nr:MerR family transcriptional regulator [Nonomuraea roseoviolacea]MCP2344411.1 DNA-binding transcriptional MerR regulator [Nonomuraea roseoviolacea subsp. carminata]
MEETWTIGELAERAAGLLGAGGPNGNGRVREVPGERLIRWYTTIGLVDPPLSRRGRIARYGRRHLLQLVAVKRLQAAGLSIADIQVALAGATDAMLEGAAQPEHPGQAASASRPDDGPEAARDRAAEASRGRPEGASRERTEGVARDRTEGSARGRTEGSARERAGGASRERTAEGSREPAPDRFWARAPRDRAPSPAPPRDDEPRRRDPAPAPAPEPEPPGGLVRGIRLAPGVTLVLDGSGRVPSTDDVQAVLGAAAPLLAVLEERKLA